MLTELNPLRIGYVVKMFPRLSETFIVNEMLELERRGVELTIFSMKKPNEGKFHPAVSSLKANVHYLEDLDPKKWTVWLREVLPAESRNVTALWQLLEDTIRSGQDSRMSEVLYGAWIGYKAQQLGITHLHAHFASLPSTLALFAHRASGIPYSLTAHAKDIYVYNDAENLLSEKLNTAKAVVTVTEYNHRHLLERYPEVNTENLRVIYNGLDLSLIAANGKPRQENMILGVGRLVPKKGFDVLLDACNLLKQRGVTFRCQIVGGGEQMEELLEQRDRLGLDPAVEFLGPMTHDQIMALMAEATLLCLPCVVAEDGNRDALPTVLLEALACELPAISTRVSGIPEIIESEKEGILVEPNDAEQLAVQISRLLAAPSLRNKFATAGRRKAVERFDLKKSVGRLLEIFSPTTSTEGADPGNFVREGRE